MKDELFVVQEAAMSPQQINIHPVVCSLLTSHIFPLVKEK